jgi:hypothetical protein
MSALESAHIDLDQADYTISEDEHARLWRAYEAMALLAALDNEIATRAGITADGTAAVADFIREELLDVCMHAQRIHTELEPDEYTRPVDLI